MGGGQDESAQVTEFNSADEKGSAEFSHDPESSLGRLICDFQWRAGA